MRLVIYPRLSLLGNRSVLSFPESDGQTFGNFKVSRELGKLFYDSFVLQNKWNKRYIRPKMIYLLPSLLMHFYHL